MLRIIIGYKTMVITPVDVSFKVRRRGSKRERR